jgi:hypothetical protein
MFCPQCATESTPDLKYCRSCGANLKVIGKAVTLSEAIARSDGIPAKLKDIFSNIKIAQVTEDVSRALDKMKVEMARSSGDQREWVRARGREEFREWARHTRKEKTAAQRRENHLTRGFVTMFSGIGLSTFLYFLGHALVLKLPPDAIAQVPFELTPVIHVIWLVGLIPTLSGLGRIIAGLSIRPGPPRQIEFSADPPLRIDPPAPAFDQQPSNRYQDELTVAAVREAPASVTDRTTNILESKIPVRQTDEMNQ